MRQVAIVGVGMTKIGKSDKNVVELLAEAALKAMDDAGVGEGFDEVFVGNMAAGEFEGMSGLGDALVSMLSLEPTPAIRIENMTASGASAIHAGWLSIASGKSSLVLVAGGEKMTSATTEKTADIVASFTHPVERDQGVTLPALVAMAARTYLERYNASRESLAYVAVKNHHNGSLNPLAQFQRRITVEEALSSPVICDPLRLYDFCPISDGAAALVLAPLEDAGRYTDKPVKITGIGAATDTHAIQERDDITRMDAVRIAGEKAYRMSGRKPSDVHVAELHDMATVLEIMIAEELGFFERGSGWREIERGAADLGGELPINTSGGLKARGHPLGGTGVAQVVELVMQLQGRCGERQAGEPRIGLACNLAGFANAAAVTIVERGW